MLAATASPGGEEAREAERRHAGGRVLDMVGGNEWLIIAVVALVLFGGSQIPKLARNLGQAQKEFKKGLADGKADDGDEPVGPDKSGDTSA